MNSFNRLSHLDGLRGLAALIVVFSHFVGGFFPVIYGIDIIAKTPINLIYSGHLAVCIFFCLSGFVLSIGFISNEKQVFLIPQIIKRYVRLVIPIFFSIFFACALIKIDLMYNHEVAPLTKSTAWLSTLYCFSPSWIDATINALITVFFVGSNYVTVLWTIPYEFFGSILVFLLLFLRMFVRSVSDSRNLMISVYLCGSLFFLNSYLLCFIAGMMCAELYAFQPKIILKNNQIIFLLLLAGYIGSYPALETSTLYLPVDTIINFIPNINENRMKMCHIFSASILLFITLYSPIIKKVLTTKFPQFLGKISFSLYLVHLPIICSFSCATYITLSSWQYFGYYSTSLITCLISFPIIIIASVLFTYIDEMSVKLARKVQK